MATFDTPSAARAQPRTALISAEAGALCNAEHGQVSAERVHHCNGYRSREGDTRTGTIELTAYPVRRPHVR
ncbi:hypothetical protein ABZ446_42405 [Streptomyces sp. NPDC005813]|uniref:hypothetical protein n=1 Tax=Streptomyces sp. NPDC005813 TaxID=3155592 RepID=UPI00340EB13C